MENTSTASTLYRKERSNTGFWLVVLGAALWGVDPLFRILLLETMTSTQIVLVEHIIVSLVALPVLWKFRDDLKQLRARHWIAVIFISWGGSALATVLFTLALTHNDPNTVLLLQKCSHFCDCTRQSVIERNIAASFRRPVHYCTCRNISAHIWLYLAIGQLG